MYEVVFRFIYAFNQSVGLCLLTLCLKHILNPELSLCLPTVKAANVERIRRLFLLLQRASTPKVREDRKRQSDAYA